MATRAPRGFGHHSGVARALELVGERWALLIVRDLLVGARRYGDLKASLPRIPTNILSDRLRELDEAGVIRRVPVVRGGYELTDLGRALEPVVWELERWGLRTLGVPGSEDVVTADGLVVALRAAFRPDQPAGLPPTRYELSVGEASVAAVVADGVLQVFPAGPGALPQPRRDLPEVGPDAVVRVTVGAEELGALLRGEQAEVYGEGAEQVERFRRVFRVSGGPQPPA